MLEVEATAPRSPMAASTATSSLSDLLRSSGVSSHSSAPFLREDEDDDDNEIVLFGDPAEHEEEELNFGRGYGFDYQYDSGFYYSDVQGSDDADNQGEVASYASGGSSTGSASAGVETNRPGYTRGELAQTVTFVHSNKDAETGDFIQERKPLSWCLEQNKCEQVEPGVWAGAWYFTYLFGKHQGERAWAEAKNTRLVKESFGKAQKVDSDTMDQMLQAKAKGNRAFSRGQHKTALDSYLAAEKLMGGDVAGMYLVPNQRAELVKILSNQAECYLRMNKYESALLQSTAALKLDKTHKKSILRRAKALFHGCKQEGAFHDVIATQIMDDLKSILDDQNENQNAEALDLMRQISTSPIDGKTPTA